MATVVPSDPLADAETVARDAIVELEHRGTFTAGTVVALVDGSAWCQTFFDLHRPDAVRILDFPHAAEHLSAPARAVWGSGSAAMQTWLDVWLPKLKTGATADVLEARCLVPVEQAGDADAATTVRDGAIGYLAARWDQLQYGVCVAAGYPIGSGSVESANKLVGEVRRKGSGMHWTRAHVNPMLALRNLVCNDRWAEAWPQIVHYQRQVVAGQRRARHSHRHPAAAPATVPLPLPVAPLPPHAAPPPRRPAAPPPRAPRIVDGRPTAAHPWKRRLVKDLPDRHRLPALPKS
ncbi:MAG: hypothetical protein HYX51_00695 [Chloroflexi bacterium]|nr:hypothetical protein [Chloroflexota bacterium]